MAQRKHAELIKQWADDDSLVIEFSDDGCVTWRVTKFPDWADDVEYRIKPTKPSIDWSHVHPDYKWMASDMDGELWLYRFNPNQGKCCWISDDGHARSAICFVSAKPGTCDWRDSLVQRPNGE